VRQTNWVIEKWKQIDILGGEEKLKQSKKDCKPGVHAIKYPTIKAFTISNKLKINVLKHIDHNSVPIYWSNVTVITVLAS
jgi:hypothetical protein